MAANTAAILFYCPFTQALFSKKAILPQQFFSTILQLVFHVYNYQSL